MRVLVCMRHSPLAHLAKLNAERHGVEVEIARDGRDLIRKAHVQTPNLILLGKDLTNPSAEQLRRTLETDPALKGVRVLVLDGSVPDLLKLATVLS